jgi:hypothetical protein
MNEDDTMTNSTQRTAPYITVVHGDGDSAIDVESSWDRADWQRMWLHTQRLKWRTLALVPGDDQTSTLEVANLIARLAFDRGESIRVADWRALRPRHVDALLDEARVDATQGARVVFATRSVSTNLSTVPIARAADCALLCVSLGSTSLASIKDTIEQVGREHFLGSLLVQASTRSASPKRALSLRNTGSKARR